MTNERTRYFDQYGSVLRHYYAAACSFCELSVRSVALITALAFLTNISRHFNMTVIVTILVIFSGKKVTIMKHDTALKTVCGVCLMKPKSMENISGNYLNLIRKHHYANYNLTSGDFPSVICPSCKRCLRDRDKLGHEAKGKLPPVRYHQMRGTRTSRFSDECRCSWCDIARLKGGPYMKHCNEVREGPGRPLEHVPAPPPEVKEICQGCQGEIKRGVLHKCNVTSREKNTLERLREMSSSSKQRMAAVLLDDISEEQGVSKTGGTLEIKTRGGWPKLVAVGSAAKPKASTMRKEDLMRIKLNLNLSGKQTLKLRTGLRTVFGRKSVEDGAGDYQAQLNHSLAPYFKSVTLHLKKVKWVNKVKVVTWEDRVASVCHNVEGLISHLMELREINPDEQQVLFGFDDGGGSEKLMMLVMSLSDHDEPEKKRPKYSDGVFSQSLKNTGVQKLILLADVPDCQEHHENIKQILDEVNISGVDFSECTDIKMMLILLGKQGGNATHNCIFGDGKAPYTECRDVTFGELRECNTR